MHFQHEMQAYPIFMTSETNREEHADPRDRPPSENVLLELLDSIFAIAL
jgi:hypothetical protein